MTNPPYVATGDAPPHEPELALLAGDDGLDIIRRVLEQAPRHLMDDGALLMEIGEDQEHATRQLGGAHFGAIEIHRDLAGHPRVFEGASPRR